MFQIHSTVADHYVYLAMLGPALIVAALVTRFDRLEIYFAAGAIAITLACLTLRQQMYWHDSVTLFTRATAITPDNASAHTNLGNALAERGELDDAVQQFEKAARLRPDDYFAQQCLAQALLQQHEYERSVEHAQDSLAHIPPRESPLLDHLIIAMSLNRLSRFDEAVPHLEAILQADPNNGRAAHELVIAKRHSLAP
jgi:tetratricopeptide (TPR) repeat protein